MSCGFCCVDLDAHQRSVKASWTGTSEETRLFDTMCDNFEKAIHGMTDEGKPSHELQTLLGSLHVRAGAAQAGIVVEVMKRTFGSVFQCLQFAYEDEDLLTKVYDMRFMKMLYGHYIRECGQHEWIGDDSISATDYRNDAKIAFALTNLRAARNELELLTSNTKGALDKAKRATVDQANAQVDQEFDFLFMKAVADHFSNDPKLWPTDCKYTKNALLGSDLEAVQGELQIADAEKIRAWDVFETPDASTTEDDNSRFRRTLVYDKEVDNLVPIHVTPLVQDDMLPLFPNEAARPLQYMSRALSVVQSNVDHEDLTAAVLTLFWVVITQLVVSCLIFGLGFAAMRNPDQTRIMIISFVAGSVGIVCGIFGLKACTLYSEVDFFRFTVLTFWLLAAQTIYMFANITAEGQVKVDCAPTTDLSGIAYTRAKAQCSSKKSLSAFMLLFNFVSLLVVDIPGAALAKHILDAINDETKKRDNRRVLRYFLLCFNSMHKHSADVYAHSSLGLVQSQKGPASEYLRGIYNKYFDKVHQIASPSAVEAKVKGTAAFAESAGPATVKAAAASPTQPGEGAKADNLPGQVQVTSP